MALGFLWLLLVAVATAESGQGQPSSAAVIAELVPALCPIAAVTAAFGPASAALAPAILWGLLPLPLLQGVDHPGLHLFWFLFCWTWRVLECLEGLYTACGSLRQGSLVGMAHGVGPVFLVE